MRGWLVVALVAVGCFFLTVGTVGLLRLPNVYNRMHATSKPTTLGTAAIFLASFVRFGPGGYGLPSLVGILFLFLSVPTGAHMISRAAQQVGVPFLGGVTWPDRSERPTRSDEGTRSEDTARADDSGERSDERETREKSSADER
ncbi:monovalent cation/H(+) antiporter subunit G [Halorussus halobius]|uniref:monovalent cation/H(+) antiporter subunit G n=1 Tax=Halorussus halobius TaxID=1710537 RepID=UPI003742F95B